jgi:AcrR family transcriptional regulator
MSFPCKPKWERRKEARPQELLSAALDLFVERGFAATRLDDVAKAAGVSKGTLYLYYSSKEELFKAVVRNGMVPLIGEAESMVDSFTGTTNELFRTLMRTWWDSVGNTKLSGLPKLMMAEAGNFPELSAFYQEEVIERGERMVASMLRRGMERKEIRDVDLEIDARLLISPMIMMMMWKHSTGVCKVDPDKLDDYLAHYIELALHGLRPLDR